MPTHHPYHPTQNPYHLGSEMEFEEHHVDCDYMFDYNMRCNCADLIMRDEGRLSGAEILAWAIFFVVVGLFVLRIVIGINGY